MLILVILLGVSNILLITSIATKPYNGKSEKLNSLEIENKNLFEIKTKIEERNKNLERELNDKKEECSKITMENNNLKEKLKNWEISYNKLESEKINLNNRLKEQKDYIEKLKEDMKLTFENISNNIIKQQKSDFTEQQKIVLQPFKEEIEDFKKKIQENNDINIKNKTSFEEQIKYLTGKSENLAKEAQDLTMALKGNKKLQGNWGEIQLENLFDITGLNEGIDYIKQETTISEDGKIHRPDFIINLPENRRVVVDSKISLNNYLLYVSTDNEIEKKKHIKNYIEDIKNHVKELSSKEYYKELKKSMSLDYVFMFIPLERAYIDAIDNDKNNIYKFAFDHNIAIVTPSSLMPILKTIEYLWNIEKQNKNIEKIVNLAKRIYDKLVGFKDEIEKIDKNLLNAKNSYNEAMKKIYEGKGNVLKTAEEIKELGVNTNKQLSFENIKEEKIFEENNN